MGDRLLKESDVMRIAFQLPYVVNSAFFDAVKALPSADREGHWIKHGEPPWYVIECSECGAKWQMSGSWDANNFCGNCGARMINTK